MSAPSGAGQATLALVRMELRLLARRGENVLASLVVPIAVLAFFGLTRPREEAGSLLAATIALAVVAAGFVSLGIATAYERSYGVLKRLAGAPVAAAQIVVAKLGSVLVLAGVTTVVLVATAMVLLGWRPPPPLNPLLLAGAVVLGTAAFGGLGLTLASLVRAEAALAIANGLFLAFVLLGGIVVPVADLPPQLGDLARALPSAALGDAVAAGLGIAPVDTGILVRLAAWAAAGIGLAAAAFRPD